MIKKKRTTISDVADYVGVHKTTVSRALNNPGRISKELSVKIKNAVIELNYIPNQAARSLHLDYSNTIALLIPSFVNMVFDDVITGVKSVTDKHGYALMVGTSTYSELGEETIVESYIQQSVDGIILTSTRHTERTINMLNSAGLPVAEIMNMSDAPFDINYGVDQEAAAADITRYLVDKGHRRIVFCSLLLDSRATLRKKGCQRVLKEAGLDASMSLYSKAQASFQTGAELLAQVLQTWGLVDAVFFVSDELAAGAVMECHRRGLNVGKEISICGFNDLEMAKSIYPSLSTVATPRKEMGELAAKGLVDLIEGTEVIDPIRTFPYELKARDSA